MVVSIELLDCLDYVIWLRSGAVAAGRLGLTQSTVSRNIQAVAKLFDISVRKSNREWTIYGDPTLLNLERKVHQECRWKQGLPLRIEAQYYSGPLFCEGLPGEWQTGNFDFLEIHTPLQHLRNGVIDAWIGCYPDIPETDDQDLACFDLTRLPTHLVVAADHPLVELGASVTLEQVRRYPSLALPNGAFPRVQKILQELDLWNLPVDLKRYDQTKWEGRVDHLTVGYGTCFSIGLFKIPQVVLPLPIPLEVGDTLIVRRRYADHPRLIELLNHLKGKAFELSEQFAEVRIP